MQASPEVGEACQERAKPNFWALFFSGEATLGRQLQPACQDEEQLLRGHRRQQVHPRLRLLGQLLQGLLGRICKNCTGGIFVQSCLSLELVIL